MHLLLVSLPFVVALGLPYLLAAPHFHHSGNLPDSSSH